MVTTKREQRLRMVIDREQHMVSRSIMQDDDDFNFGEGADITDMIEEDKVEALVQRMGLIKEGLNYKTVESKRKNILAIDGGGIRVLIPMIILMAIEEKTTRSIASMFTMFGGTSFGAFLISALNKPRALREWDYPKHTTLEVYKFFMDNLKSFFAPNPRISDKKTGRPIPLKAKLMGEPLYNSKPMKRLLDVYFSEHRINLLLNQLSIPAFEENSGTTFWFENDACDDASDWPVSEVLLGAMASPTFFSSLEVPVDPYMPASVAFEFTDGSIAWNNPAKHMVANAIADGADLADVFVVSIGTGKTKMQGR